MPKTTELVINTSPLIALAVATGSLDILQIYQKVWVPYEVGQEILSGGPNGVAVAEFKAAQALHKHAKLLEIAPILLHSLDRGEAAVIQLALNHQIQTVCIDEIAGRRVARLSGLAVTGSVGILLRAKKEGWGPFSIREAIQRMTEHGIWLSEKVITFALAESGE